MCIYDHKTQCGGVHKIFKQSVNFEFLLCVTHDILKNTCVFAYKHAHNYYICI